MKTNKSLLVKFLTVLCALCFSLSLVFGLVGCGEEVKSIVKTEIKNGELIVTYSDNTTANLGSVIGEAGQKGEDGKDANACEHARLEVMAGESSLGAEYADVCYVKIAICLDCGHVLIEKAGHDLKEVPAKAATCYENGHTAGKVCEDCGYLAEGTQVIDKSTVAHTEQTYFIAYEDTNMSPCTHGGFLVTVCEVCREQGINEILDRVDVAPLGHTSKNWEKDVDPDLTTPGQLKASLCDACGKSNITMAIPALNETDYVKTTKIAKEKCTDTETYNYQLTVGEQTFDYEYVTPAGNHKITDTITFADGVVYDYDPAVFTKFANQEETCAAAGFDVFFQCVECGQYIQTKAKVAHETVFENADDPATEVVELPVVATPATCEGFGYYAEYDCSVCGEHIDDPAALQIAKLDHEFNAYEITAEYADGTVKLESQCVRYAQCGKVDVIDHAAATYAKVDSTCEAEGKETWTVTEIGGVALETPLVAEKIIAKKPHMLGEEAMDLTKVYDWTVYEAKGLKGFANVEHNCAEGGFDAFFYCATCEQPISIQAVVPHTVPEDPDTTTAVNEAITVVPATCGVPGSESYVCAVCHTTVTKELTALVHEYAYTMVTSDTDSDGIDDWAVITGTCVHGDLHVVADPAKTYVAYDGALAALDKVVKTPATCEVDGIITYSWTPAGSTTPVTADVNVGKALHKLNNEYIDDQEVHYVGNGIIAMGNSTPACDSLTPGQGMFTCEVCEKPISVPVKQAHTKPATGVVVNDADCTNPGSEEYDCAVCGEHIVNPIDALDHIEEYDYDTLVEPEANVAGSIKVVCTREGCGVEIHTVVIPALSEASNATGSNYTFVVKSEATCQGDGVTTYTYVDATYGAVVFDVVVPATPHDVNNVPEYSWIYNGKVYTGKVCKLGDNKHIVVISVVDQPTA